MEEVKDASEVGDTMNYKHFYDFTQEDQFSCHKENYAAYVRFCIMSCVVLRDVLPSQRKQADDVISVILLYALDSRMRGECDCALLTPSSPGLPEFIFF